MLSLQEFMCLEYVSRTLALERWDAVSSDTSYKQLYAASAVDLFSMVEQALAVLFGLKLPNVCQVLESFTRMVDMIVQKYLMGLLQGCSELPLPVLEESAPSGFQLSTLKHKLLGKAKAESDHFDRLKQKFKRDNEADDADESAMPSGVVVATIESVYVRINSLFFTFDRLTDLRIRIYEVRSKFQRQGCVERDCFEGMPRMHVSSTHPPASTQIPRGAVPQACPRR